MNERLCGKTKGICNNTNFERYHNRGTCDRCPKIKFVLSLPPRLPPGEYAIQQILREVKLGGFDRRHLLTR